MQNSKAMESSAAVNGVQGSLLDLVPGGELQHGLGSGRMFQAKQQLDLRLRHGGMGTHPNTENIT